MKNKLVLIDGYGFLFRAYFAIKSLRRSDGLSVNGVYGFTKMLMDLMVNINASHMAIVFDTGKKTFRHNIYSQYKANRPPVPEDLIPQFPIVRDVAKALNIKILEKVGYEADDIIATVATKAEKENFEVLIVSSDKDLMQLVNENISIYDAMKDKKVHIEDVVEKWGVEPVKVLDVLSLIGDASDNVPGVPSIGPKTATELIKEFGSVENLIDNLDKIKQEKRRNAIIENLDNLKLSKTLITLEKNVDLEETIDDLLVQKIEPEKLIKFLDSMEFYSISKKMRELYNLHNSQENDLFVENNKSNFFEYKKITNIEQLKKCLENITDKLYIDLITEQYEEYDDIKAISLIDDKNMYICYIPLEKEEIDLFGNTNTDCLSASVLFNNLKNLLENKDILKISHNIKKIIRIFKKYNVDLNGYDDIGVISYVLDSGKFNHNLPTLIEQYLYNNVEIKIKNVELNNKILITYEKNKEITKITGDLFNISCFKLETIYLLYKILYDRLKNSKQKDVYYKIEQPLIKILADMEYEGIEVDVAELKALSIYFFQKTSDIEASIFQEVGYEFNIGSPKQLGEVLFEKLGFPHKNKKTGSYTTDNEVLEDLASKGYEIADKIIEWRQFSKLKSTYSDVLVKLMDKNHRVHTTFLNTNVVTGRLSSINPNIQNIPIKTEEGAKIRKTFIAKDGYKLIGADYSQIELRILAHYANVSSLIKSFNENIDVHTETAKKIFKTEEVTPEMRRQAKIINFSMIYGTTSYGLAKRLNSDKKTADIYMRDYFFLYPEITSYMFDIVKFVESNGYTKTLFGRKCHIDLSSNVKGIRRQFTERLAINSPIQGSGADIIKMATIDIYNKLKDLDAKILLQIHDELIIEVREDIVDKVSKIVKNSMENIVQLSVPLPVEVKIGNNWGEIH